MKKHCLSCLSTDNLLEVRLVSADYVFYENGKPFCNDITEKNSCVAYVCKICFNKRNT